MTHNLAQQWAVREGKTLAQVREEYDGSCIDFAGDFLDAHGSGKLAFFNDIGHPRWKYHAAAEIDGMIHDLWHDEVMPTAKFLKKVLRGGWVDYPAEETENEPN